MLIGAIISGILAGGIAAVMALVQGHSIFFALALYAGIGIAGLVASVALGLAIASLRDQTITEPLKLPQT